MENNLKEWIALSLTTGIGPVIANKLVRKFGFPGAVFRATKNQLEGLGLRLETIEELTSGSPLKQADQQLSLLEKNNCTAITIENSNYPNLLRQIPDPPIILYCKGHLTEALQQPCVAMVGARKCSTYGKNTALKLARDLASHNITVVSGLARGIDTASHTGALETQGITVAIMGTGLDEIYPKENQKLSTEIATSGALVTELPFGKPPLPQNFPYRNRIISGICLGVLVVEASEKSGSLITARLAIEQGRDVYAVPGNITSSQSTGPNYLIKDGAKLVMNWQDIVEEFSYDLRIQLNSTKSTVNNLETQIPRFNTKPILTKEEDKILSLIALDKTSHIDQLIVQSNMPQAQVLKILLELEIKEQIHQLPGKNYVRKI